MDLSAVSFWFEAAQNYPWRYSDLRLRCTFGTYIWSFVFALQPVWSGMQRTTYWVGKATSPMCALNSLSSFDHNTDPMATDEGRACPFGMSSRYDETAWLYMYFHQCNILLQIIFQFYQLKKGPTFQSNYTIYIHMCTKYFRRVAVCLWKLTQGCSWQAVLSFACIQACSFCMELIEGRFSMPNHIRRSA